MNKGQFDAILEELRQIKEIMRIFSARTELLESPKPMTAPNDASKPGKGTQSATVKRGRPKKVSNESKTIR